ncbi:MAG: hypothetical protein J6D28_01155 [Bacilli bacterium]|nr:hypothetical protein [Bacilli bacterium]
MRNKVEELDLFYGISIFNIMNKYEEFNTSNSKELKKLCSKLNNFYKGLYKYDKVTSINIIQVVKILFNNNEIRNSIINDYDESKVEELITNELNGINFNKLNKEIMKDEALYIEFPFDSFSSRNRKIDVIEFIKNNLYSNELLYNDLILLLINNYDFPKRIDKLNGDNWTYYFINILNIFFYETDKLINATREELYYFVLLILESKYVSTILFPSSMSNTFNLRYAKNDVINFINGIVLKAFHNLNKFYYIEIPEYNYNNTKRHLSYRSYESEETFALNILKNFNTEQKKYMFEISLIDKNYLYTNEDIVKLDKFISSVFQDQKFVVHSQHTYDKTRKLIEDNLIFVEKYCQEEGYKIKNLIYNPQYDKASSTTFIEFSINHNNFDYKFSLTKYNCNYCWKVVLKNKKYYKINLYLKDDFKHIVQAMLND